MVSSFAGKVGIPRTAIYSASKHALHGFFDSLRNELVHNKVPISITTCVIGSIDTEAVQVMKHRLQGINWASPSTTAQAIIRGTALRIREIYYPFEQTWMALAVRLFFPEMIDIVIRSTIAE